jgi:hypothetical protein
VNINKRANLTISFEGNDSFLNESEDYSLVNTEATNNTKNIEFLIKSCRNQLSKNKVKLLTKNTENGFPEDYHPKLLTTDKCNILK